VFVDAFGAGVRGKALYRLPQADMDRLDALFSKMQDDRDAVYAKSGHVKPALLEAAENKDSAAARRLLKAGADPNARDSIDGATALMTAAELGRVGLCNILVDGGADVNMADTGGANALRHAIIGAHPETFRWLLAHGATVKGERGVEALVEAVTREAPDAQYKVAQDKAQKEIVEMLLERGVPPDSRTAFGVTPLMWAAYRGYDPVIRILLERGALLNRKAFDGITALRWAATEDHPSTVRLLLSYGAICDSATLKEAARGDRSLLRLLKAHTRRQRPARR